MDGRRLPHITMSQAVIQYVLLARNRHFAMLDLLIFLVAPSVALYLRTDQLASLSEYRVALALYTIMALIVRMSTYYYFGIYQRYWRFVSAPDIIYLFFAASSAFLITVTLFIPLRLIAPEFAVPRSVLLIDTMLAFLFTGSLRAGLRLIENLHSQMRSQMLPAPGQRQRILIAGAGYTGARLAHEIRDNAKITVHPIGFTDDDPAKWGMQIHNLPVLGSHNTLPELIRSHHIDRVLIAMPSAPGSRIRDIVNLCQQVRIPIQTMPGVHELINGQVSISKLRNVQLEDLLRRTPIQTDIAAVERLLTGKRVLITGGGGSIGSELCRQILRCRPRQLIIVGHGENSIFEIHQELTQWIHCELAADMVTIPTTLTAVIADLRMGQRVDALFARHQPEVVFHAAAHKHVPLMEENPVEAITNNVLGTRNLLAAAEAHGVARFVMISTDKAVNPTNVMGASKRVAEQLVLQAAQRHGQFYQVVRFGNVLGSRGSVIHTFRQQILRGGPVLVTHPDITRFFMTIPEAVQLVLQAAVLGHGAAVLMLDMGAPVRIVDLARDLIELSGLKVGVDIEIAYSGLRPGEKLFEEMFKDSEAHERTEHEKIFIAPDAACVVPPQFNDRVDELIGAALHNDDAAVIQLLMQLLPEYQPWPTHNTASPSTQLPTPQPHMPERAAQGRSSGAALQWNGAFGD